MNLFRLLSDIEAVDPDVYARLDGRRQVFKHLGTMGRRLTVAAVPAVLSSVFTRAYGQGSSLPADVAAALNAALELEYLELYFYGTGLNSSGLSLSTPDRLALIQIRNDEANHVGVLRSILGTAALPPLSLSNFDYTGSRGGARPPYFPDVFSNFGTFLALAQLFEDTGIRASLGALPLYFSNKTLLEAALNLQAVEARHASHVRTMRRGGAQAVPASPGVSPKSWISGADNGGPFPTVLGAVYSPGAPAANFPGENNVVQAGLNLQTLVPGVSAAQVTEAFDEPLDANTVTGIVGIFRI